MHNLLHSFDDRLTAWIQAWPAWLYQPMLAITNVGQPLTVVVFASGLLVWALWQRHTKLIWASSAILITIIVTSVLKLMLRRSRPETEYVANMMFQSFSFPSGHSAAATVGFGFLAYAAWMNLPQPWGVILGVLTAIFGALVCVSRIYLGAHYPSDVVGGILLGLAGLAVIMFIVRPFA
ncbi:phosphatase PAP2 family protein [Candidatus Saccharibacteria bacterium]|nr:MAG: phosphatase PAP2 family protein [Candidatus Saccharibacteria bacterium]